MRRKLSRVAVLLIVALAVVYLVVEVVISEPPNYTHIDDGVSQGGYVSSPPWRTRAVLNLCEAADPYGCEVHVWEPIADAPPAPSLEWLRQQVDWIEAQRQAGRRVFVHCRNGVSRSGMVVVAYFMHKNRWSREQALEFVRSKRPATRPNPAFMERLSEWERMVLEK